MNAESIIIKIKSLRKELKRTDFENIPELKSKVLALYEQLVLLEQLRNEAKPKESKIQQTEIIPAVVIENQMVDEAVLKTKALESSIETLMSEKLSIEENEARVFEEEFKPTTRINEVSEIEMPQEITQEFEKVSIPETETSKVEELIIEESLVQEPELLHELESITEGFELPEFEPVPTLNSIQEQPKSLNELLNKSVQIGLNDRIAFINQLFDKNQEDYTRVISQVNTMVNPDEVISFINTFVKPEYHNWEGKETIAERFIEVVLKRFEA